MWWGRGLFLVGLGIGLSALFVNCGSSSTTSISGAAAPDFTKLSPSCFTAASSNPGFTTGTKLGTYAVWNDPSVLQVGSQYIMYASSPSDSVSPNYNIKIYRFVSTDKITWTLSPTTPVLGPGTSGAWDSKGVETPSVVYFNNNYHMFYLGYIDTPDNSSLAGYQPAYAHTENYKIGHAVSADGITWTKDASYILKPTCPEANAWQGHTSDATCATNHGNYVSSPPYDFNALEVGEPGAVVFQNKIALYFTAVGANAGVGTTLQVIGLVTSSDGTTWSAPQSVLIPSQTQYPRATYAGYSTPQPIVLNNQVHLFFDVAKASPWAQVALTHASSADGVSSWTLDSSAIFTNTSFSWSSHEVRAPAALLDGTTLYLWFAGDSGTASSFGISEAICAL